MGNIFSFCNQKGGVGKTTSVVNMATLLARQKKKTLLLDMDSQGNATSGLGIEKKKLEATTYQLLVDNVEAADVIQATPVEDLYIIPANANLAGAEIELVNKMRREYILHDKLQKITSEYDYILIDCPPSLGLLTINALAASSCIIVPLQCEYYAMEGLSQLLNTYELVKKYLNAKLAVGGVILTMADFRTNLAQQVIDEVRGFFKEKVFETVIPRSVKLSEAPSYGKPAVLYAPQSRGVQAYTALLEEFIKRFESEETPAKEEKKQEDEPEKKDESGTPKETDAKTENKTPETVQADTSS